MTKLRSETKVKLEKLIKIKKHFTLSKEKNTSEVFINLLDDLVITKSYLSQLSKT